MLGSLLLDPNFDPEELDETSWQARWLKFAAEHADDEVPGPDGEDRAEWIEESGAMIYEWIEQAIAGFAVQHTLVERLPVRRRGRHRD